MEPNLYRAIIQGIFLRFWLLKTLFLPKNKRPGRPRKVGQSGTRRAHAPLGAMFDLVVSNPPYVAHRELASLAPEVRDHEPRLALDGGGDGLSAYRAIARDAARVIAPGGSQVLEIGRGQEAAVGGIFAERGLGAAGPALADLAGTPRALIFRQK
jgi:release factor glutamine methyltransferase